MPSIANEGDGVPVLAQKPPRYAELAAELRAEIAGGQLQPGDPMPTEAQLVQRFRVSRFTVREALARLQAEGFIHRKRGAGTVVASSTPVLRQSLPDTRAILQYAAASSFRIAPVGEVVLSAAQAEDLGREAGERWLLVKGVRLLDGGAVPIAVTDAWLHPRFAPYVPRLESGHEALFHQLGRLAGLAIGRVDQEIRACAATIAEATALGVPRRTPCLRMIRHYFDTGGELVEMSCSVHPGERFSYAMTIEP
jgi:GntR family transcriptional regulator